ncbi:MAG: hypothetical protein ACP5JG_00285 [Anaerolineae bacterium]
MTHKPGPNLRVQIRLLPAAYSYPYNLHAEVPADRRPRALNELVCVATEGCSMRPAELRGLVVQDPLRTWLQEHAPNVARQR